MKTFGKIDLHMHSTVSDGTNTPAEILSCVKDAGIELFSLTDHDAVKGSLEILSMLKKEDPGFITGAEFSCRDEQGEYHILGYGYDPKSEAINKLVEAGHSLRMMKVKARLDFIDEKFGFAFSDEDREAILSMDNPGKPHIANMMVKYGYAKTKEQGIKEFLDKIDFRHDYISPAMAIRSILASGGIPVLAHPSYGSGDQLVIGDEMDKRLRRLAEYGLRGVEAYYSGFTAKLTEEMLSFAKKYGFYVTAGSDYHGTNKLVILGDNGLDDASKGPAGMLRFLEDVKIN